VPYATVSGISCAELSVGTVVQLLNSDAIYSRDGEKKRNVGGYPALFGLAHDPHALGSGSDRRKEATGPAA
jgi:hypothetical protein